MKWRNTHITLSTMRLAFLVIFLFLGSSGANRVVGQELSSIPGAFGDIGIGARAAATGYTGIASERGAGAMAWNPASLVSEQGMEIVFSYVDQLNLVEFGHVAWVMPLRPGRSAWGLAAQVNGDDMLREMTLQAAYSHRIRFLWVGLSVGYRMAEFGNNTLSSDDYAVFDPDEVTLGLTRQVRGDAQGFVLDAGLRFEMTHRLDMALAVRNAVAPVQWTSTASARDGRNRYFESVPMEVSAGVAYRLTDRLGGYIDWTPNMTSDAVPKVGIGVSYRPLDEIAFRIGRLMMHDRRRDEWRTFGFGIRTPNNLDWSLEADYAIVVSEIVRTQQISLKFGL